MTRTEAAALRQCPTCGAWSMTEAQRDAHVRAGRHVRHTLSGADVAERHAATRARRADLRARLAERAAADPGGIWADLIAEHDAEADR